MRAPAASTSERAGSESESSRFAARADNDTACQPRAPDWSSTSRVCAEADDAIAQSATVTARRECERTEKPGSWRRRPGAVSFQAVDEGLVGGLRRACLHRRHVAPDALRALPEVCAECSRDSTGPMNAMCVEPPQPARSTVVIRTAASAVIRKMEKIRVMALEAASAPSARQQGAP